MFSFLWGSSKAEPATPEPEPAPEPAVAPEKPRQRQTRSRGSQLKRKLTSWSYRLSYDADRNLKIWGPDRPRAGSCVVVAGNEPGRDVEVFGCDTVVVGAGEAWRVVTKADVAVTEDSLEAVDWRRTVRADNAVWVQVAEDGVTVDTKGPKPMVQVIAASCRAARGPRSGNVVMFNSAETSNVYMSDLCPKLVDNGPATKRRKLNRAAERPPEPEPKPAAKTDTPEVVSEVTSP